MLTKTQVRILQLFVANITELFTINGIADKLNMNVSLAHRSIIPLIKENMLLKTKEGYLTLNYEEHHQELVHSESLRTKEFLKQPRNQVLQMFIKDVLKKISEDSFVLLIFGSAVISKTPKDIDILLIVNNINKVNSVEKQLVNISRDYTLKFDIVVVSFESVYEMLAKRKEKNVMNEVLNKHLIVYGGETFYRLITKGIQ